jgi:hypothetical protein
MAANLATWHPAGHMAAAGIWIRPSGNRNHPRQVGCCVNGFGTGNQGERNVAHLGVLWRWPWSWSCCQNRCLFRFSVVAAELGGKLVKTRGTASATALSVLGRGAQYDRKSCRATRDCGRWATLVPGCPGLSCPCRSTLAICNANQSNKTVQGVTISTAEIVPGPRDKRRGARLAVAGEKRAGWIQSPGTANPIWAAIPFRIRHGLIGPSVSSP